MRTTFYVDWIHSINSEQSHADRTLLIHGQGGPCPELHALKSPTHYKCTYTKGIQNHMSVSVPQKAAGF